MKFIKRHSIIVFLFAAAFAAPDVVQAQKTGSVCVQKVVKTDYPTERNVGAPDAQAVTGNKVQIGGKIVRISGESQLIGGLSLTRKHSVKILFDQTPKQSFRFSFKDYDSTRLCLFQNDFYGTWQLWEANRVKSCGCK